MGLLSAAKEQLCAAATDGTTATVTGGAGTGAAGSGRAKTAIAATLGQFATAHRALEAATLEALRASADVISQVMTEVGLPGCDLRRVRRRDSGTCAVARSH